MAPAEIFCFGEILVDFIPIEGNASLFENPGFYHAPGGAPANVAAGLARLGASAAFLSQVGRDLFGDYLKKSLERVGVDLTWLRQTDLAPTALAFVSLDAQGDRRFSFYRDPCADALYRAEYLPLDALSQAHCFHFGSVSLIAETSRQATFRALQTARAHDVLISYDPNYRPTLWPSPEQARRMLLAGFRSADLVKIAEEEVSFLFPDLGSEPDLEAACVRMHDLGPRWIWLTRGAAGVRVSTPDFAFEQSGFAVDVVDSTGAGDGFMAAVLAEFLRRGQPEQLSETELREISRFANAAGALVCTRKGAIHALPDRNEVLAFLASQD